MRVNWAGNVSFCAARFHRPSSVDELRRLVAGAGRVRAVGTGHSFNRIADTTGDLVSLAGLPPLMDIDRERSTVTVSAGVRYGELAAHLHEHGYALPNLGSLPHISVVGAISTGTHGSGNGIGNLATSVEAMELVTADGALVWLARDASTVSLGCLGIVTRVTLAVAPSFDIRQYVYDDVPRGGLGEIFASAYSVSAFTDWKAPRFTQVWRKCLPGQEDLWSGGKPADAPRHPIPSMSPEACTQQLGVPGPWHTRLPHFRLEHTPSSGDELQSEYFVPRHLAAEALAALDPMAAEIAAVLQVCELRTVAADEFWLSPCYRRDSLAIHFTWIPDEPAVFDVLARLEDRLAPFEPRPHWGKLFVAPPSSYSPDFISYMNKYDPSGKFRNVFVDTFLS